MTSNGHGGWACATSRLIHDQEDRIQLKESVRSRDRRYG
jgi:hypothetical protein